MVKLVRNETGLGLVPAKKFVDKTLNNRECKGVEV